MARSETDVVSDGEFVQLLGHDNFRTITRVKPGMCVQRPAFLYLVSYPGVRGVRRPLPPTLRIPHPFRSWIEWQEVPAPEDANQHW